MTNNPTIDGVSRDSVLQLFDFLGDAKAYHKVVIERCNDCIKSGESSEREEYGRIGFRTQKIAQVERLAGELRALLDAPVVERQPVVHTCQKCWGAGVLPTRIAGESETNYRTRCKQIKLPEVAALQSTIARLQARIAELESGRGEPVAWALVNGGGLIRDLTERRDVAKHWDGDIRSLYFAPPVAVVLPERKPQRITDAHAEGWNACLDATAALNEVWK